MPEQLIRPLLFLGAGLLIVLLWALSILISYLDLSRRDFRSHEEIVLLVVVVLFPIFGFAVYLLVRMLRAITMKDSDLLPETHKPPTLPMRLQREDSQDATQPMAGLARSGLSQWPAASPARRVQPQFDLALVAVAGPYLGEAFELSELPAVIGRGPEAAVRLEQDQGASRQHAEIYARDNGLRIRDLDSSRGTRVNGSRIGDERLAAGDQIGIGHTTLLVEAQQG